MEEKNLKQDLQKVLGKMEEKGGVWKTPEAWAREIYPTAFVCKRTGKPTVVSSQKNAEKKTRELLELLVKAGLIGFLWEEQEATQFRRKVYADSV